MSANHTPDHRRFFVPPDAIRDGRAILVGEQAHQIVRVLRLCAGEMICLLDGTGNESHARIDAVTKAGVSVVLESQHFRLVESRLALTLALCRPRSHKVDTIVRTCTELGTARFIIIESCYSQGAPPDDAKVARWRRIAVEASEQCGRTCLPELSAGIRFDSLPDLARSHDLSLLAWEEKQDRSLKETLEAVIEAKSVMVVIGPEGGITEKEAQLAEEGGIVCIGLGKRTLRVETAAISCCAAIIYELEGNL